MKVLVTTLGRGHFIQVASSLIAAGVDLDLTQGWIVRRPVESRWLKLAAKIIGRPSLIYGFTRRLTSELEGHNFGDFWAEFWQTVGMQIFSRVWKNEKLWHWSVKLGFKMHGRTMARMMKRSSYQIAHVKSGLGCGGAIETVRQLGMKVLVDHSAGAPKFILEQVDHKPWGSWNFWHAVQEDCDKADLLMVNSDWVKETFLMYGYPEEKIRVVYMGLDQKFNGLKKWDEDLTGLGHSKDKPLRIVFSGPFAPHKGNHDFLEAIDKLMDSDLQFTVEVLGSVSIPDEDRAKYSRAIEKIKFHGHLPQDQMCEVMKSAHIYLFPSLSEGCAKSAYEAMSMGLCVVCTKETGLPLTDGVDGHLILSRNADSIVAKIGALAAEPERIAATGKAATETLKKYTWAYYAENVKKVYNELLEMR